MVMTGLAGVFLGLGWKKGVPTLNASLAQKQKSWGSEFMFVGRAPLHNSESGAKR